MAPGSPPGNLFLTAGAPVALAGEIIIRKTRGAGMIRDWPVSGAKGAEPFN